MMNVKKEFEENAKLNYKYTKEGNISKANIYAKKMFLIREKLEKSMNYSGFLDDMFLSEESTAAVWACGMGIDLDYKKELAIGILHKLAESGDEIISRNAWMALQVRQCNIE